MASSSTITSSITPNHTKHDVFISFRGEDTRFSFTDHLYEALIASGIKTFRKPDSMNTDQDLNPQIENTIAASRASIVVMSKNYANSESCLDELALIMERRRMFYHVVIPVFYHVDPSDVRKQVNSFEVKVNAEVVDFQKSVKLVEQKVERWKAALMEVANLNRKVLSGPETKFIADIVNTISQKLRLKLGSTPPHLTGIDTRAEDINSWIRNKQESKILAIYGTSGSGKTTLAKHIYATNFPKFESSTFLEDIGKICEQPYGLCALQEQLLADILEKELDVRAYKSRIEKALQNKKLLIVLDDIDTNEQLEALLGSEKINTESKIIITTKVSNIQELFKSTNSSYKQHELKLLNDKESLELLSWYAFGSKNPLEGFKELASKATQYCSGNPLALKLLGSLFISVRDSRKRSNIEQWISTLSKLETDPSYRIQGIIRMSFDGLPFMTYRELFLHIACFFVGKDEDYVVKILEPDYCATAGIVTLINRCLLTISPSKKLMMHGLFIEMAKRIVCDESFESPAKRSRIWSNADSYYILRNGNGTETIEGLALDMRMVREEQNNTPPAFNADSLANMDSLKLLQLNYVELKGSYDDFPEDLRWLCWHGFHLEIIPSELFMGNLVALDMSYSKLKLFEPPMVIRQLKILNFKDSHSLLEIHKISRLPNLETLILWNCYSLIRISETINDLKDLTSLNITGCEHLLKSPNFISLPHSLEHIYLKNCNLEFNNYFQFQSQLFLQHLNLSNNLFEFLPNYTHLKSLKVLDLSSCSRLKCIECLPSTLEELVANSCESLEKITFELNRFSLREIEYEGCGSLVEIEGFVKLVPVLKIGENEMGSMKWIKRYENFEMCLVGDYRLIAGRSCYIQMLYEFGITSTFLPDANDPNITPNYTSRSPSLSFTILPNAQTPKVKGLNLTFKYTLPTNVNYPPPIFAKISNKTKGRDWIYNPMVFGKPKLNEVAIWLSYWEMGNELEVGDKVDVCVIVESGFGVHGCAVSVMYGDEVVDRWRNAIGLEVIGGDLSRFRISEGIYYLCRRDFFKSMEVDGLIPRWFWDSVGYKVDYTEIQGWTKTGRSQKMM